MFEYRNNISPLSFSHRIPETTRTGKKLYPSQPQPPSPDLHATPKPSTCYGVSHHFPRCPSMTTPHLTSPDAQRSPRESTSLPSLPGVPSRPRPAPLPFATSHPSPSPTLHHHHPSMHPRAPRLCGTNRRTLRGSDFTGGASRPHGLSTCVYVCM
jgi:hypothetical protein